VFHIVFKEFDNFVYNVSLNLHSKKKIWSSLYYLLTGNKCNANDACIAE
jgi:hypothetical protein